MSKLFIAKFKSVKGRFLVRGDYLYGFEGRKIHDKRQETKHGNKPDEETGLYLNEMHGCYSASDVVSLKEFISAEKKP